MRGGPFSTNLRRMFRRMSDGGAGADHAEQMMEAERTGHKSFSDDGLNYKHEPLTQPEANTWRAAIKRALARRAMRNASSKQKE